MLSKLRAFLVAQVIKSLLAIMWESQFDPWIRKTPWRRKWQPTPIFLPGKSHREESGGLQFMGSQSAGHDWVTKQLLHWQTGSLPVSLQGSS